MDQKTFEDALAAMDAEHAAEAAQVPAQPSPSAPMDDATFDRALASMDAEHAAAAGARATGPMDDVSFNRALNAVAPSPQPVGVPAPGAGTGPILPPVGSPEAFNPVGGQPGLQEPGLSDPSSAIVEAPFAGAAKSVYETKDFVLGETPQADRSAIRKAVEAGPNEANAGLGYSFTSGIGQFATGMLGAGKLLGAAKGIKAVAGLVEGAEAVKGGAAAIESAKAAAVGAIAFDPHGERLSNIVQAMPALANPINGFLAAKPGDSAALGRMKNAMESLGLDAAMMGTLTGGVALFKAIRGGDASAIRAATEETSKALNPEGHAVEEPVAAAAPAVEPADAPQGQNIAPGTPEGDSAPPLTVTPKDPAAAPVSPLRQDILDAYAKVRGDAGASLADLRKALPERDWAAVTDELKAMQADGTGTLMGHDAPAMARREAAAGGEIDMAGTPRHAFMLTSKPTSAGDGAFAGGAETAGHEVNLSGELGGLFGPEAHTDTSGTAWEKAAPGEPWLPKMVEDAQGTRNKLVDTLAEDAKAGEAPAPAAPKSTPEAGTAMGGVSDAVRQDPAPRLHFDPVSPEAARAILEGTSSDMDALAKFGSWDDAIDNGHIFGKGGSIPYQKLVGDGQGGRSSLDAFITNASEHLKEGLDAQKGGAVLSDARVDRLVQQRVDLYGEDPAALYGVIQKAGRDANDLVANMEAAYAVAQRGYQDAYTLAARIRVGALDEYGGSHILAMEALRQRIEVATNAFGSGQAMRSASGRALRRLRSNFRTSEADLAAMKGMDDDALVSLLNSTEGNPRDLERLLRPALLRRVTDGAQFLYVNNLLWGLRTHFVNLSTNGYMLFARPMERILGSRFQSLVAAVTGDQDLANAAGLQMRESARQYAYMGASIHESWSTAVQTWRTGDSVLSPHSSEALAQGHSIGGRIAQLPFKDWDSLANVLHNAVLVAAPKILGAPTRALGAADELVQQVVYRSKVQAAAHVEGIEQGLQGVDLAAYVRTRLYESFDDAGRAVDPKALEEAKVAAFQQDLLPGTLGAAVQQATGGLPWLRFILPFVKTPTNVLRYGQKLTPVLNLVQEEYRQMLTGKLGAEAQAQAMGQMAMGSLFLGTGAMLAHEGRITGGGPSDPKLKAALMATGWQPYSFVMHNSDGTRTYINYGRYDPVAMPFGMIADAMDMLAADPDGRMMEKTGSVIMAIAMGLVKNITGKTYLKSLDDTIQALTDPDKKMTKLLGNMSANMIPMSSGLRFVNPDPSLRDARNFVDYIKATVPGFSETLPAKRDAFGDPMTVHKGLWVDSPSGVVDSEMRRMAEKPGGDGQTVGPPAATVTGGVDLRDITMEDGRNAYDAYQESARQPTFGVRPIKDVVARIMEKDGYKRAPDGDAATKGTKLAIVATPMAQYRKAAERMLHADKNVRDAMLKKKMAVKAAYAGQKANENPTAANRQSDAVQSLQDAFGGLTLPQ